MVKSRQAGWIVIILVVVLLPGIVAARPIACETVASKIAAAFLRRLARDSGNILGAGGVDLALVDEVTSGVPAGSTAAQVKKKVKRLWGHTQNKIQRKCTDEQAARMYPTAGFDTRSVTDELFNRFGLPWIARMRDAARPYGEACVRYGIVQSGYAARDHIRWGVDRWERYRKLVNAHCPSGVFDELKAISLRELGPLLRSIPPDEDH